MNFQFTITAHGFEKAAQLEAELKKLGIPYEVTQRNSTPKRKRRVLSKTEVMAIATAMDKHPNRTTKEIAREAGVSAQTINRIRNKEHPLMVKTNVTKMPPSKSEAKR